MSNTVTRFKQLLAALSLLACASAFATPLTIDVGGIRSHGEFGDAANTVLTYDVGANATITGVTYQVNLTAFSPGWLADMVLSFTDSTVSTGVFLTPGVDDIFDGSASYGESINLVDLDLDFAVGADGILRLEFFEDWDDLAGVDGVWNFGTITFDIEPALQDVPEPATVLLLGAGLVLIGSAGRRKPRV